MTTKTIIVGLFMLALLLAVTSVVYWDELFGYTTLKGPIGIQETP